MGQVSSFGVTQQLPAIGFDRPAFTYHCLFNSTSVLYFFPPSLELCNCSEKVVEARDKPRLRGASPEQWWQVGRCLISKLLIGKFEIGPK